MECQANDCPRVSVCATATPPPSTEVRMTFNCALICFARYAKLHFHNASSMVFEFIYSANGTVADTFTITK